MKKLLITVAIICVAAISQAATVVWGGAVAVPGDSMGVIGVGSTAYLLYSDVMFSGMATAIDKMAVGGKSDNGGTIVNKYDITSGDAGNAVFTGEYYKSGSVDGYYAVLVNDPTVGSKLSYMYAGNLSGTTEQSGTTDTDVRINPNWDTEDYVNMNGYNVTAEAAPEPTSGILLLIGMAGLALKRKHA